MKKVAVAALLALFAGGAFGKGGHAGNGNEPILQKLDPIIHFLNTWSPNVFHARENYLRNVDADKGPTCRRADLENSIDAQWDVQYKDDVAALRASVKNQPATPALDDPTKGLADTFMSLATSLAEAKKYYGDGEYKKDSCKKGQALHAKLMADWKKYSEEDRAVRKFATDLHDSIAEVELKTVEKRSGKQFHYYLLKTVIDAKKVMDVFESNWDTKDADLTAMQAALNTYAKTADGLKEFEAKHHADSDSYGYSAFASKADRFLTTAKDYRDRKVTKTPFSDQEIQYLKKGGAGVKGGLPILISAYNTLVEKHNEVSIPSNVK